MNTDRWYYRVFQSAPDLIRALLPAASATATTTTTAATTAGAGATLGLDPSEPGDRFYRFEALELKELSHRLDGVLWPRTSASRTEPDSPESSSSETGSPELPVVLLEVQMHPDPEFHGRLSAQSLRFVQRHPRVEHLEVVVITPHHRLKLGPSNPPRLLRAVLEEVHWISLEELSRQPDLDPLLNLLTLPIRPEAELPANSRQVVARRPDLSAIVLSMLGQRFPQCTEDQLMQIAEIPREEMRHTRLVQDWLEEGRQEGRQQGRQEGRQQGRQEGRQEGRRDEAAAVTLRQLNRRCGPLSEASTARIEALPLEQLEALAEALLDFSGPADLATWLAAR